jgi:hypothetical protein
MKKTLLGSGCDMLGDLTFADKDACDPLMMADFLAHVGFMMGSEGGQAPPHWVPPLEVQKLPPLPKGETGVTHIRFKPGGLADAKAYLVEQLIAKRAPAKASSSGGPTS